MKARIPVTGDSVEPVEPVIEGVVLEGPPSGPELLAAVRAAAGAEVQAGWRAAGFVFHDEAARLEERGRLDRAGCECDSCLGDKYSGEDYY